LKNTYFFIISAAVNVLFYFLFLQVYKHLNILTLFLMVGVPILFVAIICALDRCKESSYSPKSCLIRSIIYSGTYLIYQLCVNFLIPKNELHNSIFNNTKMIFTDNTISLHQSSSSWGSIIVLSLFCFTVSFFILSYKSNKSIFQSYRFK
jgi:hypothetical protein